MFDGSNFSFMSYIVLLMWCMMCCHSRMADYMGDDVKYVITDNSWDDTFDTVSPRAFTFIA